MRELFCIFCLEPFTSDSSSPMCPGCQQHVMVIDDTRDALHNLLRNLRPGLRRVRQLQTDGQNQHRRVTALQTENNRLSLQVQSLQYQLEESLQKERVLQDRIEQLQRVHTPPRPARRPRDVSM